MDEAFGDAGRSRLWLALGAVVILAAAGGGYRFITQRGEPSSVADVPQESAQPMVSAPQAGALGGEAVEPPPVATTSERHSVDTATAVQAPRVSVGDRWIAEVVDHQDATLNYRAERTVTDVGPDRILTSVRTLGKDYVRVVEYTGEWALAATRLRSGATTAYSPVLPYLSFPLQPGKSWKARVVETNAEGNQRVHEVHAKIESWETVQVPAGTFNALKVVLTDDISKDGVVIQQGQDVSWYAPDVRRTVKTEETSLDPATGERRRRTISLVEYTLQNEASSAHTSKTGLGPAQSLLDLTPLLSGIEDSCAASEELVALLDSLGELAEAPGGGHMWRKGTPLVSQEYSEALGALSTEDKGGYTEFRLSLSGKYYGMPVTYLRNGKGNESGIYFFALGIDAPASAVKQVLRGKLNINKRFRYETEGPRIEAVVMPDGDASVLMCNLSD